MIESARRRSQRAIAIELQQICRHTSFLIGRQMVVRVQTDGYAAYDDIGCWECHQVPLRENARDSDIVHARRYALGVCNSGQRNRNHPERSG